MTFFDRLGDVVVRDMNRAREQRDAAAFADIIEGLATYLGRAIATASCGDHATMERLTQGAEGYIANETAEFTRTLQAMDAMIAAAKASARKGGR